jgi:hypothetical protein
MGGRGGWKWATILGLDGDRHALMAFRVVGERDENG